MVNGDLLTRAVVIFGAFTVASAEAILLCGISDTSPLVLVTADFSSTVGVAFADNNGETVRY